MWRGGPPLVVEASPTYNAQVLEEGEGPNEFEHFLCWEGTPTDGETSDGLREATKSGKGVPQGFVFDLRIDRNLQSYDVGEPPANPTNILPGYPSCMEKAQMTGITGRRIRRVLKKLLPRVDVLRAPEVDAEGETFSMNPWF